MGAAMKKHTVPVQEPLTREWNAQQRCTVRTATLEIECAFGRLAKSGEHRSSLHYLDRDIGGTHRRASTLEP